MRKFFFFMLIMIFSMFAIFSVTESVSLTSTPCFRISSEPVIDGVLDDACWKSIEPASPWYKFGIPPCPISELKTDLRIGFNDKAIFISAFCYVEDVKKIRAKVKESHYPNIWMDDCLEIYMDPDNTEFSFYKFLVNSIGTQYDSYMDNKARDNLYWFDDVDEKWIAKTKTTDKGWAVEIMIPWSNFPKKPRDGDIWTFACIRFDWTKEGKPIPDTSGPIVQLHTYIGATTSPGAAHSRKKYFGQIIFNKEKIIKKEVE